jgi:hypothetical protein
LRTIFDANMGFGRRICSKSNSTQIATKDFAPSAR